MKITKDFFITFIIDFYRHKDYHEDVIKIYEDKLSVIVKHANLIKESIKFNKETKKFEFIQNSRYIEDRSSTVGYIEYDFNKILDYITREFSINNMGDLTTTNGIIDYKKNIKASDLDMILYSHNTAMKKVYYDALANTIEYIFNGKKYKDQYADNIMQLMKENEKIPNFYFEDSIKFNEEINNKSDLDIMNKSFDEYDYF
jgi:hypothetical protein